MPRPAIAVRPERGWAAMSVHSSRSPARASIRSRMAAGMSGDATRPLEDLFIVDASDERGELCGRLFADLGARVVRLEPPGGARSRRLPPFAPESGASLA